MILSASNTLKPTTATTTLAPYTPQLTCKLPFPRSYDKTHGVRPRRNVRQAMKTEVSMYACVQVRALSVHPHAPTRTSPAGRPLTRSLHVVRSQKDDRGLDMAVEDAKYRMSALLATHRTATCR